MDICRVLSEEITQIDGGVKMSDYLRMIHENEENEKEVKKLTKQNEKLKEKITVLKKEI